ncbi:hypothetical protein [Emticicia fluvialis]|uniref:hypothetical protein n=1 Tax=Emticicia fluvialis TaxID=2974474 RepID=UPI00216605F7|nr:hypothetical protein [Emticicia fluvialis]
MALKHYLATLFLWCSILTFGQNKPPEPTYPRVTGYVGVIHPVITFSRQNTLNFKDNYVVGFPVGLNLWKTPKAGFSLEIVPLILSEKGTSRVSNLLIHPGVLVALGKGYTFAGRAAFETSGRYGLTPVLNKVVKKNKHSGYYIALPLPLRFGNGRPASFTLGFQFGLNF